MTKFAGLFISFFLFFSGTSFAQNAPKIEIDQNSFLEGNLYFIGYHELAHAMISEFDLPVLGREEDAADRLAILLMTPADKEEDPDYLIGSMQGWFMSGERTPLGEIAWWDEHGTDQQRGFQIACLLYGADEKRFAKVASEVHLPTERRETCAFEAWQNDSAWNRVLADHAHPEGQDGNADGISISYEKTEKYGEQQAYLKEIGLLEELAAFLGRNYKIKNGIRFTARDCDAANAYWNPDDRELTMCYELVEDFQGMMK